jgi:hypothetical protein
MTIEFPRGALTLSNVLFVCVILAQPVPRVEPREGFSPDVPNSERDPDRNGGRRSSDGRDGFATEGGSIIRLEGGGLVDEDTVRTARETASHSTGTPDWRNERGFERDVFTFTRIIFKSNFRMGGYRGGWTGWVNDYPDSDLNFSWRLQQLTGDEGRSGYARVEAHARGPLRLSFHLHGQARPDGAAR